MVQCILGDKSGNLWLSTNNGISRFNPRDNSFVNYHENDGLQGEQFNRKACSVDASGIMYFGGLRGFNMFDPSRIPAKPEEAGRCRIDRVPDSRKKRAGPGRLGSSQADVGVGWSEPLAQR